MTVLNPLQTHPDSERETSQIKLKNDAVLGDMQKTNKDLKDDLGRQLAAHFYYLVILFKFIFLIKEFDDFCNVDGRQLLDSPAKKAQRVILYYINNGLVVI